MREFRKVELSIRASTKLSWQEMPFSSSLARSNMLRRVEQSVVGRDSVDVDADDG
jgi:hypothetical protein